MRRSPGPPELCQLTIFVDRNLGRYVIPDALRAAGVNVHTMASVYGDSAEQRIEDVEWLRHCGEQQWAVLTKDFRIKRRERELRMVEAYGVQMFVLTKASLNADQQLERIVPNLSRIAQKALHPGPWIEGLYIGSVRRIWPPKTEPTTP